MSDYTESAVVVDGVDLPLTLPDIEDIGGENLVSRVEDGSQDLVSRAEDGPQTFSIATPSKRLRSDVPHLNDSVSSAELKMDAVYRQKKEAEEWAARETANYKQRLIHEAKTGVVNEQLRQQEAMLKQQYEEKLKQQQQDCDHQLRTKLQQELQQQQQEQAAQFQVQLQQELAQQQRRIQEQAESEHRHYVARTENYFRSEQCRLQTEQKVAELKYQEGIKAAEQKAELSIQQVSAEAESKLREQALEAQLKAQREAYEEMQKRQKEQDQKMQAMMEQLNDLQLESRQNTTRHASRARVNPGLGPSPSFDESVIDDVLSPQAIAATVHPVSASPLQLPLPSMGRASDGAGPPGAAQDDVGSQSLNRDSTIGGLRPQGFESEGSMMHSVMDEPIIESILHGSPAGESSRQIDIQAGMKRGDLLKERTRKQLQSVIAQGMPAGGSATLGSTMAKPSLIPSVQHPKANTLSQCATGSAAGFPGATNATAVFGSKDLAPDPLKGVYYHATHLPASIPDVALYADQNRQTDQSILTAASLPSVVEEILKPSEVDDLLSPAEKEILETKRLRARKVCAKLHKAVESYSSKALASVGGATSSTNTGFESDRIAAITGEGQLMRLNGVVGSGADVESDGVVDDVDYNMPEPDEVNGPLSVLTWVASTVMDGTDSESLRTGIVSSDLEKLKPTVPNISVRRSDAGCHYDLLVIEREIMEYCELYDFSGSTLTSLKFTSPEAKQAWLQTRNSKAPVELQSNKQLVCAYRCSVLMVELRNSIDYRYSEAIKFVMRKRAIPINLSSQVLREKQEEDWAQRQTDIMRDLADIGYHVVPHYGSRVFWNVTRVLHPRTRVGFCNVCHTQSLSASEVTLSLLTAWLLNASCLAKGALGSDYDRSYKSLQGAGRDGNLGGGSGTGGHSITIGSFQSATDSPACQGLLMEDYGYQAYCEDIPKKTTKDIDSKQPKLPPMTLCGEDTCTAAHQLEVLLNVCCETIAQAKGGPEVKLPLTTCPTCHKIHPLSNVEGEVICRKTINDKFCPEAHKGSKCGLRIGPEPRQGWWQTVKSRLDAGYSAVSIAAEFAKSLPGSTEHKTYKNILKHTDAILSKDGEKRKTWVAKTFDPSKSGKHSWKKNGDKNGDKNGGKGGDKKGKKGKGKEQSLQMMSNVGVDGFSSNTTFNPSVNYRGEVNELGLELRHEYHENGQGWSGKGALFKNGETIAWCEHSRHRFSQKKMALQYLCWQLLLRRAITEPPQDGMPPSSIPLDADLAPQNTPSSSSFPSVEHTVGNRNEVGNDGTNRNLEVSNVRFLSTSIRFRLKGCGRLLATVFKESDGVNTEYGHICIQQTTGSANHWTGIFTEKIGILNPDGKNTSVYQLWDSGIHFYKGFLPTNFGKFVLELLSRHPSQDAEHGRLVEVFGEYGQLGVKTEETDGRKERNAKEQERPGETISSSQTQVLSFRNTIPSAGMEDKDSKQAPLADQQGNSSIRMTADNTIHQEEPCDLHRSRDSGAQNPRRRSNWKVVSNELIGVWWALKIRKAGPLSRSDPLRDIDLGDEPPTTDDGWRALSAYLRDLKEKGIDLFSQNTALYEQEHHEAQGVNHAVLPESRAFLSPNVEDPMAASTACDPGMGNQSTDDRLDPLRHPIMEERDIHLLNGSETRQRRGRNGEADTHVIENATIVDRDDGLGWKAFKLILSAMGLGLRIICRPFIWIDKLMQANQPPDGAGDLKVFDTLFLLDQTTNYSKQIIGVNKDHSAIYASRDYDQNSNLIEVGIEGADGVITEENALNDSGALVCKTAFGHNLISRSLCIEKGLTIYTVPGVTESILVGSKRADVESQDFEFVVVKPYFKGTLADGTKVTYDRRLQISDELSEGIVMMVVDFLHAKDRIIFGFNTMRRMQYGLDLHDNKIRLGRLYDPVTEKQVSLHVDLITRQQVRAQLQSSQMLKLLKNNAAEEVLRMLRAGEESDNKGPSAIPVDTVLGVLDNDKASAGIGSEASDAVVPETEKGLSISVLDFGTDSEDEREAKLLKLKTPNVPVTETNATGKGLDIDLGCSFYRMIMVAESTRHCKMQCPTEDFCVDETDNPGREFDEIQAVLKQGQQYYAISGNDELTDEHRALIEWCKDSDEERNLYVPFLKKSGVIGSINVLVVMMFDFVVRILQLAPSTIAQDFKDREEGRMKSMVPEEGDRVDANNFAKHKIKVESPIPVESYDYSGTKLYDRKGLKNPYSKEENPLLYFLTIYSGIIATFLSLDCLRGYSQWLLSPRLHALTGWLTSLGTMVSLRLALGLGFAVSYFQQFMDCVFGSLVVPDMTDEDAGHLLRQLGCSRASMATVEGKMQVLQRCLEEEGDKVPFACDELLKAAKDPNFAKDELDIHHNVSDVRDTGAFQNLGAAATLDSEAREATPTTMEPGAREATFQAVSGLSGEDPGEKGCNISLDMFRTLPQKESPGATDNTEEVPDTMGFQSNRQKGDISEETHMRTNRRATRRHKLRGWKPIGAPYLDDLNLRLIRLLIAFISMGLVFLVCIRTGFGFSAKKIGASPSLDMLGRSVSVLGHSTPDEQKARAAKEWPEPTSSQQAQKFLWVVGYMSSYVEGWEKHSRTIRTHAVNCPQQQWSQRRQLWIDAFVQIRNSFSRAVLEYPVDLEWASTPTGVLRYVVDSSIQGTALIVTQVDRAGYLRICGVYRHSWSQDEITRFGSSSMRYELEGLRYWLITCPQRLPQNLPYILLYDCSNLGEDQFMSISSKATLKSLCQVCSDILEVARSRQILRVHCDTHVNLADPATHVGLTSASLNVDEMKQMVRQIMGRLHMLEAVEEGYNKMSTDELIGKGTPHIGRIPLLPGISRDLHFKVRSVEGLSDAQVLSIDVIFPFMVSINPNPIIATVGQLRTVGVKLQATLVEGKPRNATPTIKYRDVLSDTHISAQRICAELKAEACPEYDNIPVDSTKKRSKKPAAFASMGTDYEATYSQFTVDNESAARAEMAERMKTARHSPTDAEFHEFLFARAMEGMKPIPFVPRILLVKLIMVCSQAFGCEGRLSFVRIGYAFNHLKKGCKLPTVRRFSVKGFLQVVLAFHMWEHVQCKLIAPFNPVLLGALQWAAPCFLALRKNSLLGRVVVDYSPLNPCFVQSQWPVRLISEVWALLTSSTAANGEPTQSYLHHMTGFMATVGSELMLLRNVTGGKCTRGRHKGRVHCECASLMEDLCLNGYQNYETTCVSCGSYCQWVDEDTSVLCAAEYPPLVSDDSSTLSAFIKLETPRFERVNGYLPAPGGDKVQVYKSTKNCRPFIFDAAALPWDGPYIHWNQVVEVPDVTQVSDVQDARMKVLGTQEPGENRFRAEVPWERDVRLRNTPGMVFSKLTLAPGKECVRDDGLQALQVNTGYRSRHAQAKAKAAPKAKTRLVVANSGATPANSTSEPKAKVASKRAATKKAATKKAAAKAGTNPEPALDITRIHNWTLNIRRQTDRRGDNLVVNMAGVNGSKWVNIRNAESHEQIMLSLNKVVREGVNAKQQLIPTHAEVMGKSYRIYKAFPTRFEDLNAKLPLSYKVRWNPTMAGVINGYPGCRTTTIYEKIAYRVVKCNCLPEGVGANIGEEAACPEVSDAESNQRIPIAGKSELEILKKLKQGGISYPATFKIAQDFNFNLPVEEASLEDLVFLLYRESFPHGTQPTWARVYKIGNGLPVTLPSHSHRIFGFAKQRCGESYICKERGDLSRFSVAGDTLKNDYKADAVFIVYGLEGVFHHQLNLVEGDNFAYHLRKSTGIEYGGIIEALLAKEQGKDTDQQFLAVKNFHRRQDRTKLHRITKSDVYLANNCYELVEGYLIQTKGKRRVMLSNHLVVDEPIILDGVTYEHVSCLTVLLKCLHDKHHPSINTMLAMLEVMGFTYGNLLGPCQKIVEGCVLCNSLIGDPAKPVSGTFESSLTPGHTLVVDWVIPGTPSSDTPPCNAIFTANDQSSEMLWAEGTIGCTHEEAVQSVLRILSEESYQVIRGDGGFAGSFEIELQKKAYQLFKTRIITQIAPSKRPQSQTVVEAPHRGSKRTLTLLQHLEQKDTWCKEDVLVWRNQYVHTPSVTTGTTPKARHTGRVAKVPGMPFLTVETPVLDSSAAIGVLQATAKGEQALVDSKRQDNRHKRAVAEAKSASTIQVGDVCLMLRGVGTRIGKYESKYHTVLYVCTQTGEQTLWLERLDGRKDLHHYPCSMEVCKKFGITGAGEYDTLVCHLLGVGLTAFEAEERVCWLHDLRTQGYGQYSAAKIPEFDAIPMPTTMREEILIWNVDGIGAVMRRIPATVTTLFQRGAMVIALQEVKTSKHTEEKLKQLLEFVTSSTYAIYLHGKDGYAGVGFLIHKGVEHVVVNINNPYDRGCRISYVVLPTRNEIIINTYVLNSGDGLWKMAERLDFDMWWRQQVDSISRLYPRCAIICVEDSNAVRNFTKQQIHRTLLNFDGPSTTREESDSLLKKTQGFTFLEGDNSSYTFYPDQHCYRKNKGINLDHCFVLQESSRPTCNAKMTIWKTGRYDHQIMCLSL